MAHNPISKLDTHEAWALLSGVRLGRVTSARVSNPDIHPVSYVVHAGKIYFRTGPTSRLIDEVDGHEVAFESAWQEHDNAWSVVTLGEAQRVLEEDRSTLDQLPILDFAPEAESVWIAITPRELRGRRFNLI